MTNPIKHLLLSSALLLALCGQARAEVILPAIFTNSMVMQQQSNANLWGKATPKSKLTITPSWNNKTYATTADATGSWKLSIETPAAGGPYSITFDDGKQLTLSDVLIGELWLCSGQSNMEMPMKGFPGQPVDNATMDVLKSTNNNIRLFTVKRTSSIDLQTDVVGSWAAASPESVREFSATAYYFGRLINHTLGVPIGLIVAAWGGSACEAWMTADMLKAFPDAKIPRTEEEIKSKNRTPTALYNGMLHPLIGITFKGVIWYQGEDNCNRYATYADMFATLISGWRGQWQQGDFPFYYCQIAPFDYGKAVNSAYLREQQAQVEHRLTNVGMAVLLDAGLEKCIHPSTKQTAGERLALLALTKSYGIKGITSESPYYQSMEITGDTIIVSFERNPMWVTAKNFESKEFSVAGADRVFHPAKAWIVRSKIHVKSDHVPHPVAVRYGFENFVQGDVHAEGLPISSFRSDNW